MTPPSSATSTEFDPDLAVDGELAPDRILPPPNGWWKTKRPCPQGTTLSENAAVPQDVGVGPLPTVRSFECRRPDGTKHGASTSFEPHGEVMSTGFHRNGQRHGHWTPSESSSPPGKRNDTLYDDGVGIGTWRAYDSDRVTIKEHRGAREIYFTEQRPEGTRLQEGLLVDGVRSGPWIFGDGAEQRTVEYTEGKPAGQASITEFAECNAGVQRWRRCLATKQGADRYGMAEWLASYIWMWELVPKMTGHDEPLCVTHMNLIAKQLEQYGCASE